MRTYRMCLLLLLLASALCPAESYAQAPPDAKKIIRAAMDLWRGSSSISEISMTIKREDWQRSMSMKAWTKGDKKTLVRVTEPKKDAGNGTLQVDNKLWTFTPKINRVIKVPSSMMGQSWMGSDFSNKDISKSTEVLDQYTLTLLDVIKEQGRSTFVIEAVPHEDAAVVWGKEIFVIRDDYVMMEQQFWDQDGVLVKKMMALEVAEMGGRPVATKIRMFEVDTPEQWTEMATSAIDFDVELADNLFTLSNLRNPRK
ncbi:hypothetical protein SAMN02745866_01875 [Alteromonadaceae bacterium Bs31]|nr:hypothetical protein SAMN02745866_01875 [Alteromonadaceae bacterium Bs31]